MQKAINNATHVFVLELEGVLVGASETSHILKVGRGDWQRVIDICRHRCVSLQKLLLLDALHW